MGERVSKTFKTLLRNCCWNADPWVWLLLTKCVMRENLDAPWSRYCMPNLPMQRQEIRSHCRTHSSVSHITGSRDACHATRRALEIDTFATLQSRLGLLQVGASWRRFGMSVRLCAERFHVENDDAMATHFDGPLRGEFL